VDLLQLQYFFESAQNESFAKTAEKHMVPASSVSASVRRLEKELGCRLFDRKANRILLNEQGRTLQRSLNTVFGELDLAVAKLSVQNTAPAEIRILARSLRRQITDCILRYRKIQSPNVRFVICLDMDPLEADTCDLIIDESSNHYAGFQKFELCSLRVRMKVGPGHHLHSRTLTMSQLRYEPFVTMGEGCNLHRILINACKNAGFVPNIVMEVNDAQCYGQCITEGIGIGLGREYHKILDKTQFLNVRDFEERQNFYCYYRPSIANPYVLDFMDFLRDDFLIKTM